MNTEDDSETADVFIQCCVFGEVIYGQPLTVRLAVTGAQMNGDLWTKKA